jgi:hypothetical protein
LRISDVFAADAPQNIRVESFLYDDHLMVWSLTIGFAPSDKAREDLPAPPQARSYKIVRVYGRPTNRCCPSESRNQVSRSERSQLTANSAA